MKRTFFAIGIMAALLACNESDEKKITTDIVKNPNSAATSAEDGEEKEMPKMVFEKELYNFGTISQGEKVQFSYKFKNEGEAELIITSAKGSCGCTVPKWPKAPIAPGEKGEIEVVFDSNGKSGKQHKKVTIVANTMPATSVVALTGEVVAPEVK